jgi:hypothetical protein
MRDRWSGIALVALVAQIPFELRYTLFGLSNLQWTFLVLVTASVPLLIENRQRLLSDRLVQAAALFVGIQWLAVLYAPEFQTNALKGALRFTAGLALLAIARVSSQYKSINRVWVISSALAAIYALAAYAGFGFTWFFRTEEFYIGQIQRLSGSFEYPNTAAAYFAMSLPIVWWSSFRPALKSVVVFLIWCAIVLTFSKGALAAVPVAVLAGTLFSHSSAAGWKTGAVLLAIGLAAYGVLLPLQPYLWERINGPGARNPIAAEYKPPWNRLQQQPGTYDQIPLQIRNTGVTKWRSQGWRRVALAYRWWSPETETFLKVVPIITKLPHDIELGQTVEIPAAFQTPDQTGRYILVLELFSRNLDWFSQTGVTPTLIQADIQTSVSRSVGQTDLSSLYQRGQTPGALTASVSRSALWTAAFRMFVAHPFGIGPDNFRLQYGRYLGAVRWDTHLYSNNLYLELLAGSGILGLAAFGLMLAAKQWRFEPSCVAIVVFLVHGLVDFFLMTTPIYFAFWLLMGDAGVKGVLPNASERCKEISRGLASVTPGW